MAISTGRERFLRTTINDFLFHNNIKYIELDNKINNNKFFIPMCMYLHNFWFISLNHIRVHTIYFLKLLNF